MKSRRAWAALKPPITMVALLLFVALAGMWGLKAASAPVPKRLPDPCIMTSVGPELKPSNVTMSVYNGTETSGLARQYKLTFDSQDFKVIRAINADEPAEQTTIVGFSADSPEVQLVQSYLSTPVKVVADPAYKRDHSVDFIIGKDYKNVKVMTDAKKTVPLTNPTVCLPKKLDVQVKD